LILGTSAQANVSKKNRGYPRFFIAIFVFVLACVDNLYTMTKGESGDSSFAATPETVASLLWSAEYFRF